MYRTNIWTPRGESIGGGGGGVCVMNREIGIDMYTLMCIKWMTNKNLLYKKKSNGNALFLMMYTLFLAMLVI